MGIKRQVTNYPLCESDILPNLPKTQLENGYSHGTTSENCNETDDKTHKNLTSD